MSLPSAELADSHRLQASSFWRRWRARIRPPAAAPAEAAVPAQIGLPPEAWRHYRHFAWVIHEQRIVLLILGGLLAGCALVWSLAWHLQSKPVVVIRAGPSLREAAVHFYGFPEVSYDQLAFFLHGCLPLLYAADDSGHPLLPLAQGLVAPEVYREAERRLDGAGAAMLANRMTQSLTVAGVSDVIADAKSGRAAAYVRGYVTVTVRHAEAEFYPWRAQVVLAVNPVSRLNPYPFYLLSCEQRTGPAAPGWDKSHRGRDLLAP